LVSELHQANFRLGEIAASYGSPREALAYYDQAEAFLLKTFDNASDTNHADYHRALIHKARGRQHLNLNNLAEALRWSTLATQRLSSLIERHPENVHDLRFDRSRALVLRAQSLHMQERFHETLADLQRAAADLKHLLDEFPEEDNYRLDLARVSYEMGRALEAVNQVDDAHDCYVDTIDVSREVAASSPNIDSARKNLALGHQALGLLLSRNGKPSKALEHLLEAKLKLASAAAYNPEHVELQYTQANTYRLLGDTYQWLRRFDEAQSAYRSALEVLNRLDEESRQGVQVMKVASGIHHSLGNLFDSQRMTDRAIESYEEARRIRFSTMKKMNSSTAIAESVATLNSLALAYRQHGDQEKAVELGQLACRMAEERLNRKPDSGSAYAVLGSSCNNLGLVYKSMGNFELAADQFERAIFQQTEALRLLPGNAKYASFLANHYCNLAFAKLKLGKTRDSIAAYQRAAEVREDAMQQHPDDTGLIAYAAGNYLALGQTQGYFGAMKDALASFQRAVELYEQLPDSAREQSTALREGLRKAREGLAKADNLVD
jgi:tetratricopeptide (TPR) repeat protein